MRKLLFAGLVACVAFFTSCQKENILGEEFSSSKNSTAVTDADLWQGMGGGSQHPHPTPIEVSELPTAITDYVAANYPDGTIGRAGVLPDGGGYVIVIVNSDGTKVRLAFDADGNFLQVLPGCGPGGGNGAGPITPVDAGALPATITDYITANYAGGTIDKAGTQANGNYVVIVVNSDGTKVGLLFDADGNFLQVLPNLGHGGGGHLPTPIDISALPATITDYVTANYAGSTIDKAGTQANGNYVVLVVNSDGTKVALLFDADGNFLQVLPNHPAGHGGGGHNHLIPTPIDVSALPATVTDYVTANYAGGTIDKAGTQANGNYVVLVVNSDGTKVALLFDADGNFIQVLPAPHSHHGG